MTKNKQKKSDSKKLNLLRGHVFITLSETVNLFSRHSLTLFSNFKCFQISKNELIQNNIKF